MVWALSHPLDSACALQRPSLASSQATVLIVSFLAADALSSQEAIALSQRLDLAWLSYSGEGSEVSRRRRNFLGTFLLRMFL